MPARGSLFAAGAGALIDWEVLVEMETVDMELTFSGSRSRYARKPTLATMKLSRRWGTRMLQD
jgi:hypothetical protein